PGDFTDGVARTPARVFTVDPMVGGSDKIETNDGNDIVFGGIDGDVIYAGQGHNIVIGDMGFIDWFIDDSDLGDIDRIETTEPGLGGNDQITTGDGDDIIFGGQDGFSLYVELPEGADPTGAILTQVAALGENGEAGDVIFAGHGRNLVFGDNGAILAAVSDEARFGNQPITLGLVMTTHPEFGGDDEMTAGLGKDIIFGGAGD
ncbi:MAG: hypothetical protein ACNA8R_15660, partial [Nitriliruptoraceae bacterium]